MFFNIYFQWDILKNITILFIGDKIIKLSVDNDLNVYLDGTKINSDEVVEEIYLKLTNKNESY